MLEVSKFIRMTDVKKIAVVDDDDFFRMMLCDSLAKFPWLKTEEFSNGEDCLASLFVTKPNIVLLDYNLNETNPDAKNGLEILNQIKALAPKTVVVMLSSQEKYGIAMQTIKSGAEHYVVKDDDAFKNIHAIVESYR